MRGIMMGTIQAIAPEAVPEIAPNIPQVTLPTAPKPPLTRDTTESTKSIKYLLKPPFSIMPPIRIKNIRAANTSERIPAKLKANKKLGS
ncbi:hypothetical protein ES703_70612 [subsurface metagenome]